MSPQKMLKTVTDKQDNHCPNGYMIYPGTNGLFGISYEPGPEMEWIRTSM